MKKKDWNKRERYILEDVLKAKRREMSGAYWANKEDAATENILYQLKSSIGESIRVNRDDVLFLLKHAQIERKKPIFLIDFVDGPLLFCVKREHMRDVVQMLIKEGIISEKGEE